MQQFPIWIFVLDTNITQYVITQYAALTHSNKKDSNPTMPTPIIMPKMGNSVESCIIVGWKKAVGDVIAEGDALCEVETDKAVMEVESTAAGTLLGLFFEVGDEVPVKTNIAAVGEPGEAFGDLNPNAAADAQSPAPRADQVETEPASAPVSATETQAGAGQAMPTVDGDQAISPRARKLAQRKGLDTAPLAGTGPGGRVIERDVEAALASMPKLTPVAKAMVESGEFEAAGSGTGPGGRVTKRDLVARGEGRGASSEATLETQHAPRSTPPADEVTSTPVRGIRAVIASRMLDSLQTTAQLTLNASADARAILAYRKRLKASPEALGLQGVTINDLILLAVSRTLPQYPEPERTLRRRHAASIQPRPSRRGRGYAPRAHGADRALCRHAYACVTWPSKPNGWPSPASKAASRPTN